MRPFKIDIPGAAVADLRERLSRARWPDEINDDAWAWGTRAEALRRFIDHRAARYDWRAREAELNARPRFRAEIDGLNIHFVHVRGKGRNPHPLIITHGRPGSFVEMRRDPLRLPAGSRIAPPFAFAQFPVEIPCPPRVLAERFFDVRQWTVTPRGGHFAAWEQPALLAEDADILSEGPKVAEPATTTLVLPSRSGWRRCERRWGHRRTANPVSRSEAGGRSAPTGPRSAETAAAARRDADAEIPLPGGPRPARADRRVAPQTH